MISSHQLFDESKWQGRLSSKNLRQTGANTSSNWFENSSQMVPSVMNAEMEILRQSQLIKQIRRQRKQSVMENRIASKQRLCLNDQQYLLPCAFTNSHLFSPVKSQEDMISARAILDRQLSSSSPAGQHRMAATGNRTQNNFYSSYEARAAGQSNPLSLCLSPSSTSKE